MLDGIEFMTSFILQDYKLAAVAVIAYSGIS